MLRFQLLASVAVSTLHSNDAFFDHFAQNRSDTGWLQIEQFAQLCAGCAHMFGQVSNDHILSCSSFYRRFFISAFYQRFYQRQGGSQSPCRWLSRAGVYTCQEK